MTLSGLLYIVQTLALGVMVKLLKLRKIYCALFIENINHRHMRTAISRSNDPSLWFSPHSVSSLCPSSHSLVITQSPSVLPLLSLRWRQPAPKANGASTALLIQLKCYGVLLLMVKADVGTIGRGKLAMQFWSCDRFIIYFHFIYFFFS